MVHRILCVDPDEDDRVETVDKLRSELANRDLRFETAGSLADAETKLSTDTAAIIGGAGAIPRRLRRGYAPSIHETVHRLHHCWIFHSI